MSSVISDTVVFDQYSRYKACADILRQLCPSGKAAVLDVGSGEYLLLGKLAPEYQIVYADPLLEGLSEQEPDKIGSDVFSPLLDDRSFDYVVSVDTLEHIPPDRRSQFLERLFSLAKSGIIIAAPCSDDAVAADTDAYINGIYKSAFGQDYSWLSEHFSYGLPSAAQTAGFFQKKGWHVQEQQQGYAPWLKELLSFVICALGIPGLHEAVISLSRIFNNEFAELDFGTPAYRRIVIATREAAVLRKKARKAMTANGKQRWWKMREQMAVSVFAVLNELASAGRQCQQLTRELGEWGKKTAQDVEVRDTEIIRLNALLQELTQWGKKDAQDVVERDAEILRLRQRLEESGR
jgi:O-antigen biosynthesis protein